MSMAKQQSLLKNTPSTSTVTPRHSSVPVAATHILKAKFTLARSPKLQQPRGPPERRGRMRNAPLTQPPSAFPEAAGAPPRLCQWLDTSTTQPSRAVGQSALTGARLQPLSPLKFQDTQHTVEVKHPNYKQGLTPCSAEGQELPQMQTCPGQLSLHSVGTRASLLTQPGMDRVPRELLPSASTCPSMEQEGMVLCSLPCRKAGESEQQLPQAVTSSFALSCPLLSHRQQNKAHGPQSWRALGPLGLLF